MVTEYKDKIEDRFVAKPLEELRDDVEFMDVIEGREPCPKIAFAFGATGFNVAQSFGPILADIKAKNIPQVHIAGPAGLLGYSARIPFTKKHIKILLALRVHGHGKKPGFPLISGWHWAKDYLQGMGKGGIKDNVMLANAVIDQLEVAEKINKETEVEILGWSRGGTAALLFAHALIERGYKVKCAAFDPVRGGFEKESEVVAPKPATTQCEDESDDAYRARHSDNLPAKLSDQLKRHEIEFPDADKMHGSKIELFNATATKLAYFANNRVAEKMGFIENKFLATSHDGAAYPFRRFGSKLFSRYARNEVNKLFGLKKDREVTPEELERRSVKNNGLNKAERKLKKSIEHERRDQKAVDAKQLSLLLCQADKILSLAHKISEKPDSVPMKLKMEAQIGRLPNYAASCEYLLKQYTAPNELAALMNHKSLGKFGYKQAALRSVLLEQQTKLTFDKQTKKFEAEPLDPAELLKLLQKAAAALDRHVRGEVKQNNDGSKTVVEGKYDKRQSMLSVPFILATLTKSTPQLMVDTIGGKAVHLVAGDIPNAVVVEPAKKLGALVKRGVGTLFRAPKAAEKKAEEVVASNPDGVFPSPQ